GLFKFILVPGSDRRSGYRAQVVHNDLARARDAHLRAPDLPASFGQDREDGSARFQSQPGGPFLERHQVAIRRPTAFGEYHQRFLLLQDRQRFLVRAKLGSLQVNRKSAEPAEYGGRDRKSENLIPGHEADRTINSDADPEGIEVSDVVRRDDEWSALRD